MATRVVKASSRPSCNVVYYSSFVHGTHPARRDDSCKHRISRFVDASYKDRRPNLRALRRRRREQNNHTRQGPPNSKEAPKLSEEQRNSALSARYLYTIAQV